MTLKTGVMAGEYITFYIYNLFLDKVLTFSLTLKQMSMIILRVNGMLIWVVYLKQKLEMIYVTSPFVL